MRTKRLALASAIAACTWQGAALAQDDGVALVLEEIIVTATKKDEVLSDVAETVNVVTGQKLQDFNVFNFKDLEALTPGLSLKNFDPRNSGISLRGTPYDPDSATAQTVVTYWNGISVRSNIAFNQMFDIERIEVLRGPQGTLQGNTSPSGSIQIHTKRANPDAYELNARQSIDDNDGYVTELGGSVPLIDGVLGLRVSGVQTESGMYDLYSVNSGMEATTNTGAGRMNLNWLPNDDLDVSLTYEYLERIADGLEAVEGSDNVAPVDNPTLDTYSRTSLQDGPADIDFKHELVSLEANWIAADHVLTWLTGFQDNSSFADRDLDLGNIYPNYSRNQVVDSEFEIWTQELRITNDDPDFWEYVAGVYYNDSQSFTVNDNITVIDTATPILALSQSRIPVNTESFAVFMDNKFYLTEVTTLQVGARWQKERSHRSVPTTAVVQFGNTIIPRPDSNRISADKRDSDGTAVTGSIKLSHDFTDEFTGYTTLSRGFRPEGITVSPTDGLTDETLLYDEETSDQIEFGFKSVLDNGRYQVNGAVYYQTFDGFQNRSANLFVDVTTPGDPQGVYRSDGILETPVIGGINYNADAVIRGAELEATALISANWLAFAGISYNDSKFDGADVPCGNNGDAADPGSQIATCQSDGRLGPEPNWSFTANTEYTVPDLIAGNEGFVRALYKFTDNRDDDFAAVNLNLYDGYRLGGYGTWDLYLGLRGETNTGNWEVSAWARNLFDKEAVNDIGYEEVGRNGNPRSGYSTVSIIPGQTFGLSLSYNFSSM